jgi:hypothetical protein
LKNAFAVVVLVAALFGCNRAAPAGDASLGFKQRRVLSVPDSIDDAGVTSLIQLGDTLLAFVPQSQRRFYLIDSNGRVFFASSVGHGPCETAGVTSLTAVGNRLAVIDAELARVQLWSSDGTCLMERGFAEFRLGESWAVDGKIVVRVRRARRPTPFLLVLSSTLVLEREVTLDDTGPFGADGLCVYCRTAVTNDGRVISLTSDDSRFRIFGRSLDGPGVDVLDLTDYQPPVWTDAEKDSVRRFNLSLAAKQSNPISAEAIRRAALSYDLGVSKPVFRTLPVAGERTVFLTLNVTAGDPAVVTLLDSRRLTLIGKFSIERGCRVKSVRALLLFLYCSDDDGSRIVIGQLADEATLRTSW